MIRTKDQTPLLVNQSESTITNDDLSGVSDNKTTKNNNHDYQSILTNDNESTSYNTIGCTDSGLTIRETTNSDFKSELWNVSSSSLPLAITFFLQYLISVTSIFAVGKLGPKELAAASLAVCTFNITGLSVYQGMATCLDSFCSQAFGAKKYTLVGLYFQRCSVIMLSITIPLAIIWWFSGSLLALIVSDEELVQMCQTYLRYLTFGAPGLLFFETGKRFLQAQQIFDAGTYVLVISAPLSILLNWVLVYHPTYGLGFIGAPIAVSIIYWTMSFLLFLYAYFKEGKKCWGGLRVQESFENWEPMWNLALPGIIMVEAEYLAFEVLTIFAATFGTDSLAAQSIASNVGSLVFQIPFAISVAISTRIGHLVGARKLQEAKSVIKISMLIAFLISILNFFMVVFGRYWLAHLFTNDPQVVKLATKVLIITGSNQLYDGFNVLSAGILRGQSRQKIGSILNLVSYYAIALPIGYILAFIFDLKLIGLWYGLIFGVACLTIAELYFVFTSNWSQVFEDAENRHEPC